MNAVLPGLRQKPWLSALLIVLFGLLIGLMTWVLPAGADWHETFRPAALALLHGNSPYGLANGVEASFKASNFYNAPWTLLPLLPLALLPEALGRALLLMGTLIAFAYTAHKLGAKPLATTALLLSPPVVHCALVGNVDWLVALGFVLPPQIGLFFVLVKPQMGWVVALFWLVEAWRTGGWRAVLRTFAPVTGVMLLSFVIFGLWPLRLERQLSIWWSASLWPMSIPVGLGLIAAALRQRRIQFAMAASPCLSPYLMMHSWVAALLAIVTALPEMLAVVAGFWILILLRALSG